MVSLARLGIAASLMVPLVFLSGCMGRTGKIGTPIAQIHASKLDEMTVGQSTTADLKELFGNRASLKSSSGATETWEVFRGGNLDVGQFLLWGQLSHDKDQRLLFDFRNDILTGWRSEVVPDPVDE